MKTIRPTLASLLLVVIVSFFIQGICSKNSDDTADPTSSEEYFTFTLDGKTVAATAPSDTIGASRHNSLTALYGYPPNGELQLYANFSGAAVAGSYAMGQLTIFIHDRYYVNTGNIITAAITNYGNVGEYITGSYSGTIRDSAGMQTHPVTGLFKLKRKN